MSIRILVTVEGGIPYVYTEENVELLMVDYDVEAVDEDQIVPDIFGKRCFIRRDGDLRSTLVNEMFEHFGGT